LRASARAFRRCRGTRDCPFSCLQLSVSLRLTGAQGPQREPASYRQIVRSKRCFKPETPDSQVKNAS
jgi:hypothetical protein